MLLKFAIFTVLVMLVIDTQGKRLSAQQPVVIAYVGGYRGNLVGVENIEPEKLTHLLYAFANINRQGKAFLQYPATDPLNLRGMVALKARNSRLKVLLSVGGLGWSIHFSDMAMTAQRRRVFSESCVALVCQYKLDGIDLDWEFPGYPGEGGNPYRPEDKQNFTLLCQSLRAAFNEQQHKTGKTFLLTAAVDGWAPHFLPHTEMEKVQDYLDYVCLMSYNFNTRESAGGHYLYSPRNWDPQGSVDGAVNAFAAAGVSLSKLVIGAGFFPAALLMQTSDPQDRRYISKQAFRGGLARVNRMIGQEGFTRYWDNEGQCPYLFNPQSRIRIAYDDTASIRDKAEYTLHRNLAGIMYWDYFSDPDRELLNTIYKTFKK